MLLSSSLGLSLSNRFHRPLVSSVSVVVLESCAVLGSTAVEQADIEPSEPNEHTDTGCQSHKEIQLIRHIVHYSENTPPGKDSCSTKFALIDKWNICGISYVITDAES